MIEVFCKIVWKRFFKAMISIVHPEINRGVPNSARNEKKPHKKKEFIANLIYCSGLKFSNQHLELNVHPNQLHRSEF